MHATLHIDVRYFFVASTNNFNLSDYITTASELWATSPSTSSIYSSTSQYSDEPLPSYSHLLDYTPSSIDQPQPTDAILVPRECMWDVRLRCPPSVELTRDPVVEEHIRSFQNQQPPSVEDEDQDVITINTPPTFTEDSDSDVVCLD